MKAMLSIGFGLGVALLPLAGGGDPATTNSDPLVASFQQPSSGPPEDAVSTNSDLTALDIPATPADGLLESAPPPPKVALTPPAADVVKLAQAGVDEGVMLTFVTNSPNTFNLTSDAIVYLSDLGVSGEVVNAMIQHDQVLRAAIPLVASPPAQVNPFVPADAGASNSETTASTQAETNYVESPPDLTDTSEAASEPNVSYTYFYDSLAPYGSWISVGGYGPCWRPTACVSTPGWQPYCSGGHWVYTDCGWYWASSYTWGWAPFHYGRWFYAPNYGWCWSPGRVWSPAWVCWRYSPDHCGWAPLPPSAYYRPGFGFSYYGRSVGWNSNFGLQPSSFVFVPANRFCDPHPSQYRVAGSYAGFVYGRSIPYNRFAEGPNHQIINKGIPVERISAVTHTTIRPIALRDVPAPVTHPGHPVGVGDTLAVYRPAPPPAVHGGPWPVRNDPITPPAHPGGTAVTPNPGIGAHTQGPDLNRPSQGVGIPSQPGRPRGPAQGNPGRGVALGPPQSSVGPSPAMTAPHPQNSWSLPRRGEGGNQLVTPSQNRANQATPPANSAPPPNWGNHAPPVQPSSPPARPQFEPRQAPAQPVPAIPQHNSYVPPPPAPRSSPPQQPSQQPQQVNGTHH